MKVKNNRLINIGSTVTVKYSDGFTTTFLISPHEKVHSNQECVSKDSPIGRVLIGKTEGERVNFCTGKNDLIKITILKVR